MAPQEFRLFQWTYGPSFGGVDAVVWGLAVSLVLRIVVSLMTYPDEELGRKYLPE